MRELRIAAQGLLYRYNDITGKVGNSCHWTTLSAIGLYVFVLENIPASAGLVIEPMLSSRRGAKIADWIGNT